MPSNTGLTRQSPGPLPGSQPPSPGGPGSGPAQANGMGNGMPSGLAHAGHQTDINFLWGLVQELSDALQRNREQTAAIVARVQTSGRNTSTSSSTAEGAASANGESHSNNNAAAEAASLRSQLHQSQSALAEAQAEASSLAALNDDYVTFLHGTMDKLRGYAHAHASALVGAQAHYGALLEQERAANVQLRLEHGEWQAGLGRAAEHARAALRARADEVSGLERGMREARAENAVLRRLLGWQPASVAAEGDEESDGEGAASSAVADDGGGSSAAGAGAAGGGGQAGMRVGFMGPQTTGVGRGANLAT